jgi:hypothetical protein
METERKIPDPEFPANDVDRARVEAVVSIHEAIMKAIVDELTIHGKDPRNSDIIASAMAMTIHRLSDADPRINYYIATMMAMGDPRDLIRNKNAKK